MNFQELLAEIEAQQVRLELCLDVELPATAPDELIKALREHKPTLLMAIAREAQWDVLKDLRWGEAGDHEPGIDRFPPRRLSIPPEQLAPDSD